MRKRDYDEIIKKAMPEILNKSTLIIEARAKEMAPVDLGIMRSSIYSTIEGEKANVSVLAPYAIYMEYGRPPGKYPPLEAIEGWAKRHHISPWAVMKKIKEKGIEVGTIKSPFLTRGNTYRPFLRPAAFQSIPRIQNIVIEILKNESAKSQV